MRFYGVSLQTISAARQYGRHGPSCHPVLCAFAFCALVTAHIRNFQSHLPFPCPIRAGAIAFQRSAREVGKMPAAKEQEERGGGNIAREKLGRQEGQDDRMSRLGWRNILSGCSFGLCRRRRFPQQDNTAGTVHPVILSSVPLRSVRSLRLTSEISHLISHSPVPFARAPLSFSVRRMKCESCQPQRNRKNAGAEHRPPKARKIGGTG